MGCILLVGISTCSGMGSSTGYEVRICSDMGGSGGASLLQRLEHLLLSFTGLSICRAVPLSHTQLCSIFPRFLKYSFPERPPPCPRWGHHLVVGPPPCSAVPCGSGLELAGTVCVRHGVALASSHRGRPAATHYRHLTTHTQ